MFERFTERARQVVVLAQEEARSLSHNHIGTEHILLGLLREDGGLAARVLDSLNVTIERTRQQVVRIIGRGEEVSPDQIPFTPRAKKVLELALREALSLGHNYIGTEHILLGLVRENEGVAARILLGFNADPEAIRNQVLRMLSEPGIEQPGPYQARTLESSPAGREGWLEGVRPLLGPLAGEIRTELGRAPDPGDLLLVLGCAKHTLAGRALDHMGLDVDTLWGVVQKLRTDDEHACEQLALNIEEAAAARDRAIDEEDFETAARHRDLERTLRERARARTLSAPDLVGEIRRRLGIPGPPQDPESPRADSPRAD